CGDAEDRAQGTLIFAALAQRDHVGDQRHRGDHQAASADALDTAHQHQGQHVVCQAAEERANHEDQGAQLEDPFAAEHVAELAGQHRGNRLGQQIGTDDPGQMSGAAEVADDRRQRGRHDRLVQCRQQHAEQNGAEDDVHLTPGEHRRSVRGGRHDFSGCGHRRPPCRASASIPDGTDISPGGDGFRSRPGWRCSRARQVRPPGKSLQDCRKGLVASLVVTAVATPAPTRSRLGPSFFKLWSAGTVSALGTGLATVATPLLVSQRTHNAFVVALAFFAGTVPWLLFGLPAGVIADRVDRRRLMIWVDLVRLGVLAVLGATILTGYTSLPLLYIVLFLDGAGEVALRSAWSAMVPAVVQRDQLERANGWIMGGATLARDMISG